jgi:uncharacterized membrane protein
VDDFDKVLLFLHLLTVVVGIGGVMLNGVYGIQAKNNAGPAGLGITEANHKVSDIAEYFIYAIPVTGIWLVLRVDAYDFDQTWIWMSLVLYVVGLGISHGVMRPTVKKMITLQRELVAMGPPPEGAPAGGPPPQVVELEAHGKRLSTFGPVLNVLAVVLIYLMVFKPGL